MQIYSISSTNMLAQSEHLEQNIPEDDWAHKMLLKTVQNLSFALETPGKLVLRVIFLVRPLFISVNVTFYHVMC